MLGKVAATGKESIRQINRHLTNPLVLACVPALCLGLYWLAGERALMVCAVSFPVLLLIVSTATPLTGGPLSRGAIRGKMHRDDFKAYVNQVFEDSLESGLKSAIFQLEIDDYKGLIDRYGQSAAERVADVAYDRLITVLRENDVVTQNNDCRFSVCLGLVSRLDLELCIQLSGRVQAALEEPISVDGTTVFTTCCVGFCLSSKVARESGATWSQAAGHALVEARAHGAGSIRAYSDEMKRKTRSRAALRDDLAKALEKGQIQPWYQPQISTDTGLVTGFEALARWNHPNRGMIPPADFLPEVEQSGLLERLAEVMMYHAFTALKAWDSAGVCVPQVGVNFAGPELSNPKLVDKVTWELDRFDLAPERLAVEVLETVVAGAPDDTITRNINNLGKLGCRIDLDDFGTGHASIASIRRFSVSRIKIDRSFVLKADRDPEQQRMISAILTMAERLEVETLAEGVETVGEHALLAQLGCDHVQGFGIGKPMPFDQTLDWITKHNAKLQDAAQIFGKKTG